LKGFTEKTDEPLRKILLGCNVLILVLQSRIFVVFKKLVKLGTGHPFTTLKATGWIATG